MLKSEMTWQIAPVAECSREELIIVLLSWFIEDCSCTFLSSEVELGWIK